MNNAIKERLIALTAVVNRIRMDAAEGSKGSVYDVRAKVWPLLSNDQARFPALRAVRSHETAMHAAITIMTYDMVWSWATERTEDGSWHAINAEEEYDFSSRVAWIFAEAARAAYMSNENRDYRAICNAATNLTAGYLKLELPDTFV